MMGRLDFVLAFGLATGVHVAGLGYFAASGGFEGSGSEGQAALSLTAASAELSDLVADWEAVPEVSVQTAALDAPRADQAFAKVDLWSDAGLEMPLSALEVVQDKAVAPVVEASVLPVLAAVQLPAMNAPTVPGDSDVTRALAPVMPEMSAPAVPVLDAPEVVERAVIATPRPLGRPERREPSPAVVARGKGGGVSAGKVVATKAVATVSPAARKAAHASWARKIQSRIARHQTFPRGARGAGRVRLYMDILTDGRLQAVRIDRSSGVQAFDKAALQAARAAAPFPPAPTGVQGAKHSFAQWVNFSR